tara:strand:- start:646 stop:1470 length:825 start_codon:yes stop_codon:yes gene_type:complete
MKQKILFSLIALISLVVLSSHSLFIKLKSFYLKPDTEALIYLYNGTFDESHSTLARNRMIDVSLVNPGDKIIHPDASAWYEKDKQTILSIKTGKEGTGIFGVSTLPRINEYTPEVFVENMKHEGLLEVLAARKKAGEDSKNVTKKYSNHVKAIYQVGDKLSEDYKTVLGYPIELVPMTNPYFLNVGDQLSMKLLINGKPMPNIMVYASYNDKHGYAKDGSPLDAFKVRTNSNGVVNIKITDAGHWYFRTVYLIKNSKNDSDYVSNTASLTFEIR